VVDAAELYRRPRDEFVQARSALARRLRQAGDREAADAVARLRRPSLGAWVVDQLAATAPDLVADLLAAATDAMEAQRSIAGDGGQALREASSRVHALLDEVGRRSRAVIEAAGHPVTEATLSRARTTAQAAAGGGRAERQALLCGTLDRDLDPSGFGLPDEPEADVEEVAQAIAGRRRVVGHATGPSPPAGRARDARLVELERAVRREEQEVGERRRSADQASATALRLRQRAERLAVEARAAADEAAAGERLAAAAGASADDAERQLEQTRAALRAAHG
jgi:hypothetical protein